MSVPQTPADIDIQVVCPSCGRVAAQAVMEVRTKAVTTTDEEDEAVTKLSVAGAIKPFVHTCGQMTISEVE